MALHKIIKHYIQLDQLITSQESGNADDIAKVLGISKRQVYNYLQALNEIGIRVEFNAIKRTYTYPKEET